MIIGIPKEIKEDEYRVGIVPSGVRTLVQHGHTIITQTNAGRGCRIPDEEYTAAGATVVETAADVYAASDMIVKVKEPLEPEYELLISENKPQAKAHHSPDVDVVIMDQMIPGSSGLEIFKELKADDPQVRVIFLTAFGTIEAAIEAIQL